MNRTTNILGFAFLALAVTMAATITMRNAPSASHREPSTPGSATKPKGSPSARRIPVERTPDGGLASAKGPRVTIPAELLEALPQAQKDEWLSRAEAVENQAIERLEQLTGQLGLSPSQRGRLFPALVRSAPSYDPAMVISGDVGRRFPDLTPAEEIHALLESEQREAVENSEVDRQLWWQDLIEKLEADLTVETGGGAAVPTVPADPGTVAPEGEREAPEAREDANLFDLLKP
jgi:hypothetical protein